MSEALLHRAPEGHDFLPGGPPFACGVVARANFEIVHVTLRRPVPYREGFTAVAAFLAARDRPAAALCGIELCSPAPRSFDGFAEFNAGYGEELTRYGLWVDGANPLARTNVAPVHDPPAEVSMWAFSFTVPTLGEGPTFIVAGAAELRDDALEADAVVRPGETGLDAMAEKAGHVMGTMGARLAGLDARWDDVTAINVYAVAHVAEVVRSVVLPGAGRAANGGVRWHPAAPPVEDVSWEMDLRGVRRELVVDLADV